MCGIFFSCSRSNFLPPSKTLLKSLKRRGPDDSQIISSPDKESATNHYTAPRKFESRNVCLTLASTVLSLRGECVVRQPLRDSPTGSLLCWNGEAWKIGGIDILDNDTKVIFDLLIKAAQSNDADDNPNIPLYEQGLQNLLYAIGSIAGPFAFVFYDARHKRVLYGRDALGRRSLLMSRTRDGSFAICSICDEGDPQSWAEIEADGIYVLDLTHDLNDCLNPVNIHERDLKDFPQSLHIPWTQENNISQRGQRLVVKVPPSQFD